MHQKSDPSKTHPKSQKSDPMAPKARFWSHFCTLFSPLFAAFSQNINFLKTCIFPRQGAIFKVLAPHFSIKNPFKNHVFSRCLPGPPFSSFHVDFLRQNVIFGPPLGSAGAQNGTQSRPNGAKRREFSEFGQSSAFVSLRTWSRLVSRIVLVRSWLPFWKMLVDFGRIFDGFSVDFGTIVDISCNVLEQTLADTCTASNRNEQSRTAKNLQKSRQRNCIVAICRFAKRQQLQQTHAPKRQASKWGAAVLAPHGAFGSAPCSGGTPSV